MAARDFDLTPHPTTSAAERWNSAECGNFDTERQIRARPHSAATTCCTCPTCRCERFFLWGLIQRDARFPQKKMGCEDHVRVAANDHCFTHRLAFRFKWQTTASDFVPHFVAEWFVVEARSCRWISTRFFAQELASSPLRRIIRRPRGGMCSNQRERNSSGVSLISFLPPSR